MRSKGGIIGVIAAAIVVGVPLGGCQRTIVDQSAVAQYPGTAQEFEYWLALEQVRIISNDDVLHGLLLFADGTDDRETYEERLAECREREWIPYRQDPPGNESAQFGLVAYALCDILDIRGGLTMTLTGRSPRYCTRELAFLELIPNRTENQSLSGLEFLDLMRTAAEWQANVTDEVLVGETSPGE